VVVSQVAGLRRVTSIDTTMPEGIGLTARKSIPALATARVLNAVACNGEHMVKR
jgi:hypothetical protein